MSVTIRDLMTDPALFGDQFSGESWKAWRTLLAAFYGLPLLDDELRVYEAITKRASSPEKPLSELALVVGRRGGKSVSAALLAIFEAFFSDHHDKLAPGEMATVMILAADRKQARAVFRYISGLIESNQMLRAMVVREDKESIELSNRATIEVHTASFRATRGYTAACVICDEIAFWRSDESANPDHEILNALRPALATLDGKLILLSSPYAKRGALYDTYRLYYGRDEKSVLVAQAPSQTMNPLLPDHVIKRAMTRDPEAAKAEYLAEFRADLEQFVSREVVEACVEPGRYELGPTSQHHYRAFVDPSGGSRDSMTLAIGHEEGATVILDATREVSAPFSPEQVVKKFSETLKAYGVGTVIGDRYAGEWPRERFKEYGINYEVSQKVRSDLYRDTLPLLMSQKIELLDDERIIQQFTALERRTSRAGKDAIDHPPGQHDDLVNAIAGLIANQTATAFTNYADIL